MLCLQEDACSDLTKPSRYARSAALEVPITWQKMTVKGTKGSSRRGL